MKTLFLLALAACRAPQDPPKEETGTSHQEDTPEDTHAPVDTTPPEDTTPALDTVHLHTADTSPELGDTEVEVVPGVEDPSAWMFTMDEVIQVEITLPEESIAALNADGWTYAPGDITFHGDTLLNVGVRLKGHLGSFRDLSGKAGFKVDLNEYEDGREYYGLKRFTFSNLVQDSSFVHDPIAYTIYANHGVPTPRIGYVWVKVNGEDYGLYEHIETYDKQFLEKNYEDPDGNLYDGDYYFYPDWSYTLLDFDTATQDLMQQDEGEDVGFADVHAVTAALDEACGQSDFMDRMDPYVDWDHHLHFWAIECWVGQYDGYSTYRNNYRVYFDPTTGKAELLPWDHDWAFYEYVPMGNPTGRLSSCCLADATCSSAFLDVVAEMITALDPGSEENDALLEDLADRTAFLNPYLAEDPRKEAAMSSYMSGQEQLRAWIGRRSNVLRRFWGL